jgi:hypothetical protein
MVLLAHLMVWGAVVIGAQESIVDTVFRDLWSFSSIYAPIPGATVILSSFVVLGAAVWSGALRSRTRVYRHRRAVLWTIGSLVFAVVSFIGLRWLLILVDADSFMTEPFFLPLLAMLSPAFALLSLTLFIAAGRRLLPSLEPLLWRALPFLALAAPVASVAVFLALWAAATADSGYLPLFVRWAGLIGVGTVMGLAVARLAISTRWARRSRLRYWLPVAAAFAVPWGILHGSGQSIGWANILQYAVRLDDLLPLILLSGCVVLFRQLGTQPVAQEEKLREHRMLGIVSWFIVLSGSYTFASSVSAPAAAAMTAAALAAWLIMPSRQVAVAALVLRQSDQEQAGAVTRALRAGAARRVRCGARQD